MEINDGDKLTELDFSVDEKTRTLVKKLANERDRLQRPDSVSSNNDDSQLKLQQAMIRRQELLDRIRQEQVPDDHRPRTYSPRRRYTPSPLPPPSRRSLPDLGRNYHFNWYTKDPPRERQEADKVEPPRTQYVYVQGNAPSYPNNAQFELPPLQYPQLTNPAMSQTKHIIEHQFRPSEPQKTYVLPPIQAPPVMPQVTTIQAPQPVVQQLPPVHILDGNKKDTMFNKSDFMDMMMLQNAQMHHMVMQQMMLQNLPGGGSSFKLPTAQVPVAPFMEPMRVAAPAPVAYAAPPAAPMVHHYGAPDARSYGRARDSNSALSDGGNNYYSYH